MPHPLVAASTLLVGVLVAAGGAIDSFNGTLIAVGLLTTAFTGAYTAYATHHVKKVAVELVAEVKSGNAIRTGQQIDDATTARLLEIPHDERTLDQQHHIDQAPEPGPPQGPSR